MWNNVPQRCLHPNPWNPWRLPFMQNGLCECDKVKDPEMEINLDYSGGARVLITGVSTLEKQREIRIQRKAV